MTGYAVVDIETTGFHPGWHHRIVEVGIVHVDRYGRRTGEWSTLLNPTRDLGPVRVHGIRAADLRQAPTFEEAAGWLARLLQGRVLVAHNLAFDVLFLCAEYDRLGKNVPLQAERGLCTMRLAERYLPHTVPRTLGACCSAAGVPIADQHQALADAQAAASLLGWYIHKAKKPPPWDDLVRRAMALSWPPIPLNALTPAKRGSASEAGQHFLARLVDRLPRAHKAATDTYLAVLDDALLDRHISVSEGDALVALAEQFGLDRGAALRAHHAYLDALARAAWRDGVVTEDERVDLHLVGRLLGVSSSEVDSLLETSWPPTDSPAPGSTSSEAPPEVGEFRLQPGDQVVFTGEMSEPRELWEGRARTAGLDVKSGVTKSVRLLVAADPDSMSGKARKARDYGIPLVTEDGFARLFEDFTGVATD